MMSALVEQKTGSKQGIAIRWAGACLEFPRLPAGRAWATAGPTFPTIQDWVWDVELGHL